MSILDAVGIVGVAGTFYFGIRSMFQSSDFETLQRALRAYNQALYNNLWRMGENAEQALKQPVEAKRSNSPEVSRICLKPLAMCL